LNTYKKNPTFFGTWFPNHEGVFKCVKCVVSGSAVSGKYIYYNRNIKNILKHDRALAIPQGHTSGQYPKPKKSFGF
jgi:hypothetical protein